MLVPEREIDKNSSLSSEGEVDASIPDIETDIVLNFRSQHHIRHSHEVAHDRGSAAITGGQFFKALTTRVEAWMSCSRRSAYKDSQAHAIVPWHGMRKY